ncbi:MAG: hypothetical protein PWQ96_201 [Clostridia bacterium]|jgi:hypothetical protein|nr:hypothetical protein [Clostridiales bacterium]MDK2984559.1 hypothetical protein [Clostridia bacterium]
MDLLCPICNGLTYINHYNCPNCGALLQDNGPVNSFLGDYSPYQDSSLLDEGWGSKNNLGKACVHLLSCPQCGKDKRINVELITL